MSGLRKNRRVKRDHFSDTRKSRNVLVISFSLSLMISHQCDRKQKSRIPQWDGNFTDIRSPLLSHLKLSSHQRICDVKNVIHVILKIKPGGFMKKNSKKTINAKNESKKQEDIWQLEVKWDLFEGSLKAKDHWWLFQHFLCWFGLIMCRFFLKSPL